MSDMHTESRLPSILHKLGKMTSIRDTYLVEQSLLRTLGPLLGVLESSLYRMNDRKAVVRTLHHSRIIESDNNGVQRVSERIEEVVNDATIAPKIRSLLDTVTLLGKPCNDRVGSDLLFCFPLHGGEELCGYVVFQRNHDLNATEDAIIHGVLEVFSNYYSLLDTSQRDQLTGLLNRYSLELNLDRLWTLLSTRLHKDDQPGKRRTCAPQSFWLGVIDIDFFKKVNDNYGHIIGDEVLIITTRLLESSFRQSDLLYRYGGEEFIAIIAADDLASATQAFDRARRRIEEFSFPQVGHVTISGGFSGADPTVLPQEVIHRADRALYEAKSAGRNRIFNYDVLVQQGVLKEVTTGSIDLF